MIERLFELKHFKFFKLIQIVQCNVLQTQISGN